MLNFYPHFVKKYISHLSFISCFSLLFITSCNDDIIDFGKSLQPSTDTMIVKADTFHLDVTTEVVESTPSRSSIGTYLLGSMFSSRFGQTKADLLLQFACPEGFSFPAGTVADSVRLELSSSDWYGVKNSSLEVSAYEVNIQAAGYRTTYNSNFNPLSFCDMSIGLGKKLVTTAADTAIFSVKLDNALVTKFFNAPAGTFDSNEIFLDYFKGVYLTTNYGNSLMYALNKVNIVCYYHYTTALGSVINATATFPASKEVRQLNRFVHDYSKATDGIITTSGSDVIVNDSVACLLGAAGMHAKITLPLKRLKESMSVGGRRLQINSAIMYAELIEETGTNDDINPPADILLIKSSDVNAFFANSDLSKNIDFFVGTYNPLNRRYEFQMYTYLQEVYNTGVFPDSESFTLIPVKVQRSESTSTSDGSILSVIYEPRLLGATFRTSTNTNSPFKLSVVYSGY